MATLHDDVRSYDRSRDPEKLGGPLSSSIGSKRQFETYYTNTYAKQPPSRERITAMATVAEIVVVAGESTQPPEFAAGMRFLTAYRLEGGRIRDLWHLAWRPPATPTDPDTADVVRRWNAARTSGDEKTSRALVDPGARHFCPSDNVRDLADRPCATSTNVAASADVAALFAVGDLVVEQSRFAGNARISIYRVHDGRIVTTWLLADETKSAEAVVRGFFRALQDGDEKARATMLAPEFTLHRVPTEPHVLEGPPSQHARDVLVDEPAAPREVQAIASVGDLVIARVATYPAAGERPDHVLTVLRVSDGRIKTVWRIARESNAAADSGAAAIAAIQRLVDAHNRGDAGAFVALYHADARSAHVRHDRTRLGGGIAKATTTPEQRLRFYREFYAKKPPIPVEIVASVALGEWVATRERYFDPDGSRRDHLTIYRVRDGSIVDDWHLAP
jgi:predicted SnoaL-like aldol condensation-catalyzing enzyme